MLEHHPLLKGLRQIAREEMVQIDAACAASQEKVRTTARSLVADLKEAVARALEATPLRAADLARDERPVTLRRLGRYVAGAVGAAGRAHAEGLQSELLGDLAAALNRLYPFAMTVDRLKLHAERRLATSRMPTSQADAALVDRLGHSWAVYREGSEKGADQDTNTAFAAGSLVMALGLPAVEQVLATLVAEDLTSGTAVEQFKREYWRTAGAVIDNQWASGEAAAVRMLEVLVTNAFDRLKREIDRGLDQVMPVFDALPAVTDLPLLTATTQSSVEFSGVAAALTPGQAPADAHGSAEQTAIELRCLQCGALIKAGVKFCGDCGTPVGVKNDNGGAGSAAALEVKPVAVANVKAAPSGQFVIIEGPQRGQSLPVNDDMVEIGRKQLDPDDTMMSRRHVIIRRRGKDFYLEDVSTNGTWINNGRIAGERLLTPGDTIRVGKSVLRFEV